MGVQPYAQRVEAPATQPPLPLHIDALLAMLDAQEAAPQLTDELGYVQDARFTPLQVPPQVPLPLQGVRGVVTATQVPRLDALTQDSQLPLQATLQHTPSEPHTPLAQSLPVPLHASPFGLPTQVPFEQVGVFPLHPPQQAEVAMHPLLHAFCPVGQFDAQAVPLHPNIQVIIVEAVQAPAPLQTAAEVAVPLVHDAAAPHEVVVPGNTQLVRFVPSQWPAQVPVPAHGVRGVVVATHVPRLVVVTQDSHCPLHAALQHTPSEPHTVLVHSLAAVQAVPLGLRDAPPLPPGPEPPVAEPPPVPRPPVPEPPVAEPRPPVPAAAPAPPVPVPPLPAPRPPVPAPRPPVPDVVPPPLPSGFVPPVPVETCEPPLPEPIAPPVPGPPVCPPVPDEGRSADPSWTNLGRSPQEIPSSPITANVANERISVRRPISGWVFMEASSTDKNEILRCSDKANAALGGLPHMPCACLVASDT